MAQKKQIHLYKKFFKFFIKKGNSRFSLDLIKKLINFFSKKYKISAVLLFSLIYTKLNSFIELRKIKKKRRISLVPFSIGIQRRIYLVLKVLKQSIFLDKRKISVFKKLRTEIFLLLFKEDLSKSLKIRNENLKTCLDNRSNIHFRW